MPDQVNRTSDGEASTADAISAQAIGWARERADLAGASVAFHHGSIFDARLTEASYDLVYDSGCFHHIPPHRRDDYAGLVHQTLGPGASYGLVCFRPEGGSGYTDRQVYERASLGGGLAAGPRPPRPTTFLENGPCASHQANDPSTSQEPASVAIAPTAP
jgi:Methyltransferase domain